MIGTPRRLPSSRRDWQRILDNVGLRPSKGRGQNFLVDDETVQRILALAELTPEDAVIEIGPGLGALTGHLLRTVDHVTAIELDWTLARYLETTFGEDPRLHLLQRDVLSADLSTLFAKRPTKVVSNLPYSAAAAIVRHVLEAEPPAVSLTVMVQLEVAERMLATPPDMGLLSVATQIYAEVEMGFLVPPDVFMPAPEVESAVIVCGRTLEPLVAREETGRFFALVAAGFRHKRKNIANSMEIELRMAKAELVGRLRDTGIDPTRRAETLSIDEWLGLFRAWPAEPDAAPMIEILAPAKLNLGLEILGRRDDGLHEIRSMMTPVSLVDRLTFAPFERVQLSIGGLPVEASGNLVCEAVALAGATWGSGPVAATLTKRIPLSSGLGGGSSDAAATLLALSHRKGVDRATLVASAVRVGSDVPFFLAGTTALVSGRGEAVTAVPPHEPLHAVIVVPGVMIPRKTATMYGRLTPGDLSDGSSVDALSANLPALRTARFASPTLFAGRCTSSSPSCAHSPGGSRRPRRCRPN
jgi:16S rRNA (adenine1518-N6/adenine1519-N6)-dimethyltransferase